MSFIKEVFKRSKASTPKFFKRLRNWSLILGAVSVGIITSPVALPATLITVATYLGVASGIAATVSQLPVENVEDIESENDAK